MPAAARTTSSDVIGVGHEPNGRISLVTFRTRKQSLLGELKASPPTRQSRIGSDW
jgi:hypothetical protein